MKSNFKRFLSLMLAFVMVLSNVPFQAFAEDSAEIFNEAPAHVHAYESSVTKEPTCGEEGERTFTCSAEGCDTPTYTEAIPATGEHQYAEGVCGICGGEDPDYVAALAETPELPTATVTEIENDELTFAMNFKADEADDAQLAYYGSWHADFELTVNKDVTFNANGGANGYLSGQYDEWSENWVNVPFEDVTLKANESLKIMAYAAEAMGQSGLKVTYNDIVTSVKDFDCGVFFEPEFLAANPDLEVTLELRMYNPADENESYVIGETYTFTVPTPELPTATVTEIENDELTFAMNFKADEADDAQLAYYGSWYADFELTVNKDVTFNANGGANGYLSGQYDEWSENWVNVPFEDVTLKANESLKIMAYAAEAMGQSGLKVTYNDIVTSVKDFDCGVFFEPEFLAANPDLEVTLELRMYNPADEEESYVIGETYTFTIPTTPELPTATVTEIENDELTFAMNFKADEVTDAQLAYYGDWYADFELTVDQDITLNANGGADGYLSGQYDEWSENWVNVPFEDVTLKANESLKIMAYAAEMMGQPGLKQTYNDVVTFVKDFDCGMFFETDFIKSLEKDLTVTLELKMYNPENETESYTVGETYTFVVPVLPTATVTEIENDKLTFAMNFQADEASEAQEKFYGKWYADFELTANQDIVLNANGGADGYLSGQYDAWSENWVNVPFEDVTLQANESLKIMEYASELMGQPGLKYTYGEVYDVVKNFDCGMFLDPNFLYNLKEDLEITLELKMYNNKDAEDEGAVIGETYTFTVPVAPELPTATAVETANDELTFAMNFKADEATDAQLAYYGGWYADFELTVNKDVPLNANGGADGYLSGQYDAWSENWVNVPFENVTLKANESLKIMEYASELMGQPGLKYTYREVYEVVKDFDCGMFFTEEFLEANPDLVVTLELKMYNPVDESLAFVIGDTYTFFASVAQNVQTGKYYNDVNLATVEAQEGQTVILLKNVDVTALFVYGGVTFDLNGKHLTAKYATAYGNVIDGSEKNTGLLTVPADRIMLQADNPQLPINSADGYRFVEIKSYNKAIRYDGTNYVFQPMFEEAAHELLLAGKDVSDVEIIARVTWMNGGEKRTQDFSFRDETVRNVVNSYKPATGKYGRMYSLTLKNLPEGLTYQIVVKSKTLVELTSEILPAKEPSTETGNVTTDANNKVTEQVSLTGNNNASAEVPSGTQLEPNTTNLVLTVDEMENSQANITLGADQEQKSYNIHIDGVASGNTVPMLITLKEFADKGLNSGNLSLYHVENGATNAMTQVFTLAEVDEHNEFYYDPATGDVTMALATFSEIALVSEEPKWEGKFDYAWYDASKTELTIANADQLAAFGAIVGGMDGQTQDSFDGKTVKLIADIDLNDGEGADKIFYPIGYNSSDGKYEKTGVAVTTGFYTFEGTFDGNGHTISNFYQNTWEMKGDNNYYDATLQYYRDGMGLFGKVYGGTVKNLTVKNFKSDGEYTTTGVIAAYADGATFENIAVFDCNPRVYNIGNGGIVGRVGCYAKEEGLKTTFKNITVDNSNKISALWGSYDVACGGIVGQYYPTSAQTKEDGTKPANAGVHFENCHVSAIMDVYNDVCANYQYYAYRYTGMMIGSIRENETIEGYSRPKMAGITASNCTVDFGDWNDYYYCEIIDNTTASYTHDYQMSRLTEIKAINGTTITYLDGTTGTVPASGRANYVIVDYTKGHGTANATCYHFKDGAVWTHDMGGIQTGVDENGDGQDDLKEDKQHIYLEFKQLFTGYGWGVTSVGLEEFAGISVTGITEGNPEESVVKFEGKKDLTELPNNQAIKLSGIFTEKTENTATVAIQDAAVVVGVTDMDATDGTVTAEYVAGATWEESTITFIGTGKVKLTIQDYYFCTPTTIEVTIAERVAAEKFETKFTGGFLYRVGNQNAVKLDSLFKAKDGVTIGTVSVTVEPVEGTSASGAYTSNAIWTNGTIQFSGTGVVKVTITDNDYCTSTELKLQVVDAVNTTSAASATKNNVVLLNDCGFSSLEVSGGYTLYGNGFTMTCASDSVAADFGYAFVTLNSGTLDNVQIVCPNFDYAALYKTNLTSTQNRNETDSNGKTRYYNAKSGVMATGNSQILNSRISGARAAVNVAGGNLLIENSQVEGGAVATILVNAANTLMLRDVTLVQKPTASTYDSSKTLMGFSVLLMAGTDGAATPIVLEGILVQNAWADDSTKQYVPAAGQLVIQDAVKQTEYIHSINGVDSLNLGFAYLPEDTNHPVDKEKVQSSITDNRTNKDVVPYGLVKVTQGCVYSYMNSKGTEEDFTGENTYTPDKYNDDVAVTYTDTADGLTTAKTFGTDGWVYELNVDLDKLSGYKLDFSKLFMTVNGVAVTDYMVNGGAKPTSPVAVIAGGTPYSLTATVVGKEYTATFKVTGTETSKESPSLVASNYEAGLCVASSYGGTWHGAAPALKGIQIKYWSVAEKQYKTINLADYTPTTAGKQNGTNTTWTYSPANGDFTLTLTGGQVHSGNSVYAMPVVCDNTLYFVAASSNGLVNTGNSARTIPVSYSFKDNNNGDVLTFSHTWSVAENKDEQYDYSDFCNGTLTKLEAGGGGGCVTPDTLITLSNGTQVRVDSLTGTEELLVWNLETGKLDSAPILFVDSEPETEYEIVHLYFSDGTDVKVIYEHGFWDYDLNKYVYLDANAADYVGHTFAKQNGDELTKVQLTDVVIEKEVTTAWSPVTAGHLCYFVNGMLSMPGGVGGLFNIFEVDPETMTYDYEAMQRDIETYGLFTYEEMNEIVPLPVEMFETCGGAYLKVSIGKGNMTIDDLIYMVNRYVSFFA